MGPGKIDKQNLERWLGGFDGADVCRLRDLLRKHQFADDKYNISDIPILRGIETSTGPGLALWAIFQGQSPIAKNVAFQLFGAEGLQSLLGSGFLLDTDGLLRPVVEISRWKDLLICADLPGYSGSDAVFSVSETTKQLDALRLPIRAAHAVDVGSGSGALALRLAAQADRVTAIDVNARAVAFTEVNCLLNGINNVSATKGDLLSDIEPHSVDLILGNLPFVISPDQSYLYRDGSCDSQTLTAEVIRQAENALTEKGVAQLLCSWPQSSGVPAGYKDWLEDLSFDSVVIGFSKDSPKEHAEAWLSPEDFPSRDEFISSTRRWVRWLEESGVDKIVSGVVNLRATRSSSRAHVYFDAASDPKNEGGAQVRDIFRSIDLPDDWGTLKTFSLRLVRHSIFQRLDYVGDGYDPREASIVAADSAGVSCFVAPEDFPLLFSIDGKKTSAELAGDNQSAQIFIRRLLSAGLVQIC
jgi:SAM-dependent methyltransferase